MGNPRKRYDICAARPYGDDKKHWINVGRLTEWDDGGLSIELHAVPTGSWFDGRLSCFEQEQRDQGQARGQRPQTTRPQRREAHRSSQDDFSDDAPF